MIRRFLVIWLPFFATDRLGAKHTPLATIQGGTRLVHVNAAAFDAGIIPGHGIAQAQAILPGLATHPADPVAEVRDLERLARWCERWTPWAAPLPWGHDVAIGLDVTGCAPLWSGEDTLLALVAKGIEDKGFTLRAALADTVGAAWGAARCAPDRLTLVPEGAGRQLLSGLPIAALRLPAAMVAELHHLGLRSLRDLTAQPRAPLARRFGPLLIRRLDQWAGHVPEPLSPLPPASALTARIAFADPIGTQAGVDRAVMSLSQALALQLEKRGLGARRLELRLFRVDARVLEFQAGTLAPERNPARLTRLFAENLSNLDAGFGIEAISLTAPAADPFDASQADLDRPARATGLAPLLDRLIRRLGADGVWTSIPRPTPLPEDLCAPANPLLPPISVTPWPAARRPVRLFSPPRPALVETAGGTPIRLDGRPLLQPEGPERIALPWWPDSRRWQREQTRDYWRVRAVDGTLWWLFRDGVSGRWFVHGGGG